ncbi:hypothetical protein TrVFT333_009715 [Trichoderma virens FT-333]|nr:hypothetical protein TrVFT333_009715 [Trichoderma virens FT-333]
MAILVWASNIRTWWSLLKRRDSYSSLSCLLVSTVPVISDVEQKYLVKALASFNLFWNIAATNRWWATPKLDRFEDVPRNAGCDPDGSDRVVAGSRP